MNAVAVHDTVPTTAYSSIVSPVLVIQAGGKTVYPSGEFGNTTSETKEILGVSVVRHQARQRSTCADDLRRMATYQERDIFRSSSTGLEFFINIPDDERKSLRNPIVKLCDMFSIWVWQYTRLVVAIDPGKVFD